MRRSRTAFLREWLGSSNRRPLVIRGARQVGKTWLIRNFAQESGLRLLELNFERRPDFESLFLSNDPKDILLNLRAAFGGEIGTGSLLFLDEIQAAPKLLGKLRWFAEDMPELPVIAAGSLLEFTLADHSFSMPVGRINYMHLEPFSFEEFLEAGGQKGLREFVEQYDWTRPVPQALHAELLKALKEYLVVGGMPLAVSTWVESQVLEKVNQVHFDLLATYRDDFAKYRGRLSIERLEEVMAAVPRQLGQKFVFSKVNPAVTSASLKQALDLLTKARVCHRVAATAANGLPLGAEVNEKYAKVLMLDCGLCVASLGLTLQQLFSVDQLTMINNGAMAEQLVGQLLRTLSPPFVAPALYYWQRTERSANAEVDFVVQHRSEVVPIEVKAGSTGSLKSLHQFMGEKRKKIAVRINSDMPSRGLVEAKLSSGEAVQYQLLSLPFYLLGQLHRLLDMQRV